MTDDPRSQQLAYVRPVLSVVLAGVAAWLFGEAIVVTPSSAAIPIAWRIAASCALPVTMAAVILFYRLDGNLLSGVVAAIGFKILYERFALVSWVSRQCYQQSGAVLVGWVLGYAVSRARTRTTDGAGALRHHELGYRGALAMLAASYVSAGVSKLLHGGLAWITSPTVQLMALSHTLVADGTLVGALRAWAVHRPHVCFALQGAALVIELGAIGLVLGPRWRTASATALFGMHVGIKLIGGIGFGQPRMLLLALCFPWPVLARLRARSDQGTNTALTSFK